MSDKNKIINDNPLHSILHDPVQVKSYALKDWDLLIRQAKTDLLLVNLFNQFIQSNLVDVIPSQPLRHFKAAETYFLKELQIIHYESQKLYQVFENLGVKIIYLKGAAYLLANTANAQGRFLSDIDILVPSQQLSQVEASCFAHGWLKIPHSKYDETYYRRWMHEIPPLRQMDRGTVLDIHHTILPLTSKNKPDPCKLISQAICIDKKRNIYVLQPIDMVLHSATHLFFESEYMHGLRDLVDLKMLMEDFSKDAKFYTQLVHRAKELTLERPLFYALHYCQKILGLKLPSNIKYIKQGKPNPFLLLMMDFLFLRILASQHHTCVKNFNELARFLLFIRGHYLKMPLYLLLPHLFRKTYLSFIKKRES